MINSFYDGVSIICGKYSSMTNKQHGYLQSKVLNQISCMCKFFFDIRICTLIKYPVCFDPLKDHGQYLQVNFIVQANLDRLGKVLFLKNFREIQGK